MKSPPSEQSTLHQGCRSPGPRETLQVDVRKTAAGWMSMQYGGNLPVWSIPKCEVGTGKSSATGCLCACWIFLTTHAQGPGAGHNWPSAHRVTKRLCKDPHIGTGTTQQCQGSWGIHRTLAVPGTFMFPPCVCC
jgi:hypothetical protein